MEHLAPHHEGEAAGRMIEAAAMDVSGGLASP